jgi:hypothetical protein
MTGRSRPRCLNSSCPGIAVRTTASLPLAYARISISIAQGSCIMAYGHFTSGGIDDRMESTLPPVFSPKMVPRS